ncbi:integrin alpha-E-like isoform X1 [Acipenser oxyrinchus oxyrinchus]|uniref:Integrin alpha-E-like isoform X1 n=1 Tax=Acipenser oxyrinchus oxyrinchus TaxID=40147 RepID=A0AAD8CGM6_ACIOX|nr:integrin alpha-E-like isoform X1 [Acipenser oxyrinchus oxyrinchus]
MGLIIGSSIGGFVILAILVLILFKCGFFKRGYKQNLPEEEMLPTTSFAIEKMIERKEAVLNVYLCHEKSYEAEVLKQIQTLFSKVCTGIFTEHVYPAPNFY